MKKVFNNNPQKEGKDQPERFFISLRVDLNLISEINAYIDALKAKGDFTYGSTSEFIRKSLLAYRDGMELPFLGRDSKKRFLTLMVDHEIFSFYQTLPARNKAKIVERSLGSYLRLQSNLS